MNVVIVTTTGLAVSEALGEVPDGIEVGVIASARAGVSAEEAVVVPLPAGPLAGLADRLSRLLQGNAPLRMIQRISPLDPGARFWRAVRREPRVTDAVRGADLLIAADRDANFACWQLARRADVAAVSGYAAGKKELSRRSAR